MTVKVEELPVKLINVNVEEYNITVEKSKKCLIEVYSSSNGHNVKEGIKRVLMLALDHPEEFDEFIKVLRES